MSTYIFYREVEKSLNPCGKIVKKDKEKIKGSFGRQVVRVPL